jgi:TonB family protein
VTRRRVQRRSLPALREPVREARSSRLDRAPLGLVFAGTLLVSGFVHVAGARALWRTRSDRVRPAPTEDVRVSIVEKPPLPKVEEEPQPVRPALRKRTVAVNRSAPAASPSPPEAPPPPPTEERSVPDQAPALLPGISLSATTTAGSMKVRAGGSPGGTPGGGGGGATPQKLYKADEFAEPYALTEEPVFLDNVSLDQVRRFYPEEARKQKIEGVVRTKLLVDYDGTVVHVAILTDPGSGFGKAAAKLARLYRFTPAKVNGKAVATEIQFVVHFELDQ